MFGMELFFKSAAVGIKIFQKGMENAFGFMEFFMKMPQKYAGFSVKPDAEKQNTSAQKPPATPAATAAAEEIQKEKPLRPETVAAPVTENKAPRPAAKPEKSKAPTAIGQVLNAVVESKNGIGLEDVMKITGFDRKKAQNNLYKLKKRGDIKADKNGLYTKKN